MTFNANITGLLLALIMVSPDAKGQEEAFAFREPLFFSELDKEQSSPQAVRVGGVVFVSAMHAPGDSLEEQLRTVYIRLQSVLGNYGLRIADVAQERIYLLEGGSSESVQAARRLVYGEAAGPATTIVKVAGFESVSARVQIELIAVANPDVE